MRMGAVMVACAMLGASSAALAQQQQGANDTGAALRFGLNEVTTNIAKSADMVPADKYSYRPTASVRTFGEQIAHIIDGQNYYCARGAGRNVQWSDATEKGPKDKATLVQKLKQSIEACNTAYGASGNIGQLMANIAHDNLHYGNIVTYLRMMGMVPPSS